MQRSLEKRVSTMYGLYIDYERLSAESGKVSQPQESNLYLHSLHSPPAHARLRLWVGVVKEW